MNLIKFVSVVLLAILSSGLFPPQSPLKVPLKPRAAVETSPCAIILLVKWNSKGRTLGIIEGTRVT